MKGRALADDARALLMRQVTAQQQQRQARRDAGPKAAEADPTISFTTLPGYEELAVQRRVGRDLGLSPYFRMHDARAGDRTAINGQPLLNFSSYDYLGLNGHPQVQQAAKDAIDRYGLSAGASRHVGGERPAHRSLERALAKHYDVDDAIVFVSGYATNVGVIGQLVGPDDLVIMDSVIHNSALTGGVLSGANRRSFPHNDLDTLDEILSTSRGQYKRALIVVEGLYSMHGDYPDLPRLVEIKRKHRAWLMVDEAHALGVIGRRGYGLAEHFDVPPRDVDIWMGTLSKTLAGCGGYIAGSEELVYYLRCTVGAFVYSVAMPPLLAASTECALAILHREPQRVRALQDNAAHFAALARQHGLRSGTDAVTAVAPVLLGDSLPAIQLSQRLLDRGINVQPVVYPAVPAKESRLRFFLTATHRAEDIAQAVALTAAEMKALGIAA